MGVLSLYPCTDSCITIILQFSDSDNMRIKIKCLKSGRTFDLVRLFLTSAFENFDVNKYAMITESKNQIDLAITGPMFVIQPGVYNLIVKDGTALSLQRKKYIPIIPTSRNNSRRTSFQETKELVRDPHFKTNLAMRDSGCVVTGVVTNAMYLEAAHIVAFAYWKDHNRDDLPVSISNTIASLPNEINDIQNGFLLRDYLHNAFDRGDIAFRECDGDHYVVAIDPMFFKYDGQKLQIRNRSFPPPHPELLRFHLQLSVLKNMCGAGEDYSDYDDDDDDGEKMQDM